ncbi:ArsR/SmtB family transcription factor [Wenxinia saemankumensis]|uniref:DNA-binding transcriptional regulator, ArsR family n=1 Tax=Wenxinia saemankumensis TaxID=1447782 RepID=A0A1M6GL80_9RHOB|nr:metalloregulator ArsR/SmtB family transcription factor [Wenxinia saemankumensis]SHJ10708.1 DNA-binding transcriptional regulator, ArsR family [Wenxinia saemankumensis]
MENSYTDLDPVFRSLADPTRRAVVQRLGRGDATISELAEPFPISLPTFLKHIASLEAAGLIETIKVGRVRTCSLRPETLGAAERWFEAQRELWRGRYARLDDLLEDMQTKEDRRT